MNFKTLLFTFCILFSSNIIAQQCNDGIDNDFDGFYDFLNISDPANDNFSETFHFQGHGPYGGPNRLHTALNNAGVFVIDRAGQNSNQITNAVLCDIGNFNNPNIPFYRTTVYNVCRSLGYATVASVNCKSFTSPSNNEIAQWQHNASQRIGDGAFYNYNAGSSSVANYFVLRITCQGELRGCADGIDNNNNGLIDLEDPGCINGNDSNENFHDPSCTGPNDIESTGCNDNVDNDGDTLVDRLDPGCWDNINDPTSYNPNSQGNENRATTQCANGIDDDGNGLVDLADPGCLNASDNAESGGVNPGNGGGNTIIPDCANGRDDDGDGLVDLADPGCVNSVDSSESGDGGVFISSCTNVNTSGVTSILLSSIQKDHALNQYAPLAPFINDLRDEDRTVAKNRRKSAKRRDAAILNRLNEMISGSSVTVCPANQCQMVDRSTDIQKMRKWITKIYKAAKRLANLRYQLGHIGLRARNKVKKKAIILRDERINALEALPTSFCSG